MKKDKLRVLQAEFRHRNRRGQRVVPTPVEVVIVQGQVGSLDGRFSFRLEWRVRSGIGASIPYVTTKLNSIWSAGSVEEMLHAVQAAELAVAMCPGVKRAPRWVAKRGRPMDPRHDHVICSTCKRWVFSDGRHDEDHCEAVRMVNTKRMLSKLLGGRVGVKK